MNPMKPAPLTHQVSFRVTDAEAKLIAAVAKRENRRIADIVRIIFRLGIRGWK